MSVTLTLGVSSAGTSQGREEEEPYSTEGRRTRSLPSPTHLSHTLNYFPATYTVSPSFLSTPSGGFGRGRSRQYPSAPRACSSSRPAQDPGLLPPQGQPTAAQHSPLPYPSPEGTPRNVPLGGTFTLPGPNDRHREGRNRCRLILPVQKTPLPPTHRTTPRPLL